MSKLLLGKLNFLKPARKDSGIGKKSEASISVTYSNDGKKKNSHGSPPRLSKMMKTSGFLNASSFAKNNKSAKKSKINIEDREEEIDSFELINKGTFKEMVDYASPEEKVLNLIDDTLELFKEKTLNSNITTDSNKEKFELIEKNFLEKMKKENEEFKAQKILKSEEFFQVANEFQKTKTELKLMNEKFNNVEKNKSDFVNEIYKLQDSLKDILIQNSTITELINKEKVEKDNIYRALVHFQSKNNKKLPEVLKEIYNKFNNDYYTKSHKVNNSDKIDTLKNRIEKLEKVLKSKNEEIIKKKDILKENENKFTKIV
jgi:hypothetical protein